MIGYLKYYRTFSQQETQFIDFVENMNKLEAENEELRARCTDLTRILSLKKAHIQLRKP